jgi:hypothetical protein
VVATVVAVKVVGVMEAAAKEAEVRGAEAMATGTSRKCALRQG